jgi:hypothetical protein
VNLSMKKPTIQLTPTEKKLADAVYREECKRRKLTPSPRPAKKLRRPMQLDGVAPQVAAAVHAQEAKKRPKAEVVRAGFLPRLLSANRPRVVVEFSTPAEARAFARFWGMSEGERVKLLVRAELPYCGGVTMSLDEDQARAVLALLAPNRRTKSEG